jgi:glycerol-3-phosphate acyltransferase PlsY
MNAVLSVLLAYLLGSIPFAYLVSLRRGVDIRRVGDGNVGAFNVFRHAGLEAGLATLVLDIGKGAVAVLVARVLHVNDVVVYLAGIAAVVGHNWPVFLGFRGGRGEAAVVGVFLALVPWAMLCTLVLGVIVLFTTKNSIRVGMALFIPLPVICAVSYWIFRKPPLLVICYTVILPCLTGLTHWLTTRRLPPDNKKEAGAFWIAGSGDR